MAHRLLGRGFPRATNKIKEVRQQFEYLLVLDFEATCEKNVALKPQEIIEFPCVALSTEDWRVKDSFHQYVKPRVNATLTPFCTELTGIMQDTVDDQPHFPQVFAKFNEWLNDGGFLRDENTSAFVTCGDWDLKTMLPNQCQLDGLSVPKHFDKWIDLKRSYCDATDLFPRSLKHMLIHMELPMQGRLHSGLHDVNNMIRIIVKLKELYDATFKITSNRGKYIQPWL